MLWGDFLKGMLEKETVLDNLLLSLNDEDPIKLPAIIKASILLTDNLLDTGKKNMFVFPEQQTCSFFFMLLRTLFNISEGRIKKDYDPYSFTKGERIKLNNSVVEFVGVGTHKGIKDNIKRIFIRLTDGIMAIPIEAAPFFQHVDSKLLSSQKYFDKDYSIYKKEIDLNSTKDFIQKLSDYKTHLDSSVVFIAPILNSRKLFLETSLNGVKISDVLLLAQADLDGERKNMAAGQLSGTPAIVLCQDIYAVNEAIDKGLNINTVFFEATQIAVDNQLDALDDLINKDKPIMLLTDQVNLNDFSNLESRGFNIWTWNENNISPDLYINDASKIDIRVKNTAQRKVNFVDVTCPKISSAIMLLYKNKKLIEDKPGAIIPVFWDLYTIARILLSAIVPLKNTDSILQVLDQCRSVLVREERYIGKELFTELKQVTDSLTAILTQGFELHKISSVTSLILSTDKSRILVIIPRNAYKDESDAYLKSIPQEKNTDITVVYPNEYLLQTESTNSFTIVSNWIDKSTMNMILNSNITPEITVLLYEIEKRWKNAYMRSNKESSKHINALNLGILSSIDDTLEADFKDKEDDGTSIICDTGSGLQEGNELEEIELILRHNKYRQYISPTSGDRVEAIPVSFVGDLIAFYRTSHTLLTATRLIRDDYEKIEEVKPVDIRAGDFIIERETQRDLIAETADVILENSGLTGLREMAHMWKESLNIESNFSDENTIYEKLSVSGCKRSRMTVHLWLDDNNMITPLSRDDLIYIAKATEDSVLLEMVDKVFEAGKTIKRAHVQAGHYLAGKVKTNLASTLAAMGFDGFNIWKPIDIEIEDIGMIKILKVIDVDPEVSVDATSTNRLIDTNRVILHGD